MKNSIEDVRGEHVRTDKVMAELVERGVAFHHALGRTVATAYLREHAVPAEVIRRVFSSVQARRPAQGVMKRHTPLDELGHHRVRSDMLPTYILDTVFHAMAPCRMNQCCIKF